jgi:hypothetical protein
MTRLRSQEGFAIPIAIWMLLLGLLFGGLAMSQALLGLNKATASWNSTRAHAAAEAALRTAIYRINSLALNAPSVTHMLATADWTQCVVQATATDPVATATIGVGKAWCDPAPIDLGGGATATYQLSAIVNCNAEMGWNPLPAVLTIGTIQDCLKRRIVAVGTVDGVKRRVYQEVRTTATAGVIAGIGIGVPSVISNISLQLAAPVPGTLRECTAMGGTAANPAAGC